MKNLMQPMKVGQVRYTPNQLDEVDLQFQVGHPLHHSYRARRKKAVQHVTRGSKGWVVFGEGNKRLTAVAPNRQAAIKIASRIAQNKNSSLVIHEAGERFLEKLTFTA